MEKSAEFNKENCVDRGSIHVEWWADIGASTSGSKQELTNEDKSIIKVSRTSSETQVRKSLRISL